MTQTSDAKPKRTRRPRDAATLVVYRRTAESFEVLMGQRHEDHVFLPNHYVFPGGAVHPSDSRVRVGAPLATAVSARLERACTPARARALAAAAIRETFEETGLRIGAPDPSPGRPVPADWVQFFAGGLAPNLECLDYVARAVTPSFRPRRFNARFFMAPAEALSGTIGGDGELTNIRWFTVAEARRLEIPLITRVVLGHVQEILDDPAAHAVDRPMPFYSMVRGRRVIGEE